MSVARSAHRSRSFITLVLMALASCMLMLASGCETQQNANKEAFAKAVEISTTHEKWGPIIEKIEYEREWIRVWVKPSPSTLPEEKGGAVMFVAQTMGDILKADERNTLKELKVYGNIEIEELWVFVYDFKTGKTETEKSRLTTTM